MTGVKSGTLIVSYSVGSRYEPAPISGVSHFLEHMLFKGTERRPDPKQISEEIEGVGGVLNAATSREGTSYWFKAPSSHFTAGYDVLADIVRNSTIDPAELDKERLVILEEIRSIQDSPEELVHDVIDEVVWGDQPIGRSIAGTEETVGGIDRETMVDFWQRNYEPSRLVIAAGGDVRHDDVVALTERYFGDLTEHPAPDETTDTVEDQTRGARAAHRARDRAGAPLSRDAGAAVFDRAALCAIDDRGHSLLGDELAALPGDPREARSGLLGLRLFPSRTPTSGRACWRRVQIWSGSRRLLRPWSGSCASCATSASQRMSCAAPRSCARDAC